MQRTKTIFTPKKTYMNPKTGNRFVLESIDEANAKMLFKSVGEKQGHKNHKFVIGFVRCINFIEVNNVEQ